MSWADWCLGRIATALERLAAANDPAPGELLPDDFPGLVELHEAGILHYEALPRTGPGLAMAGLDGVVISRILTRLKAEAA